VPVYEYECTECGERLEVRQSFTDDPLTECPVCSGRLRKVLSPVGVVFKGSGFYRTDSRKSESKSDEGKPSESGGGKESAASGSGPSESSGSGSAAGSGSGSSGTPSSGSSGSDSKSSGPSPKSKAATGS
jgi:putative FmdB family regulatory protein